MGVCLKCKLDPCQCDAAEDYAPPPPPSPSPTA
jgi:hypothetical protein